MTARIVWTVMLMGAAEAILVDRILVREHLFHRDQWMTDGCPMGSFCRPRHGRAIAGIDSRGRCVRKWLWRTPAWMQEDRMAFACLCALRVLYCAIIPVIAAVWFAIP